MPRQTPGQVRGIMAPMPSQQTLVATLREFARERDWGKFHTPKNLAMALSVEVGELVEIFQWLTPEEARDVMAGRHAARVEEELADIYGYLLRLADVLEVDLTEALASKIDLNRVKYPVASARGHARKYDDLEA